MSRFEDAPMQTVALVEDIVEKHFPNLSGALIKVMYDVKKRKVGGKYVFGRIKKTNDELKAFVVTDNGTPYDYIMYLDKLVWEAIDDGDKDKLVFHELCHCLTDFDSNDHYKIQDHEIQTFYAEMEYTKDDPRWIERVSVIGESVHDPEAEPEMPIVDNVDTDNMV